MPQGSKDAVRIRHERFAREWLKDYNGTAAYQRAGYQTTGNAAAVNARKLLKQPDVQAIIQAQQRKRLQRIDVTVDRLVQEEARIAHADPRDLLDVNGQMIPVALLPTHVATTVAVVFGPDGAVKEITQHKKQPALELLAKHLGVLKDQPPPPQWSLDPATLAKMSTEDLETALTHAEKVQELLAGKKREPEQRPHLHDVNRIETCCAARSQANHMSSHRHRDGHRPAHGHPRIDGGQPQRHPRRTRAP